MTTVRDRMLEVLRDDLRYYRARAKELEHSKSEGDVNMRDDALQAASRIVSKISKVINTPMQNQH